MGSPKPIKLKCIDPNGGDKPECQCTRAAEPFGNPRPVAQGAPIV